MDAPSNILLIEFHCPEISERPLIFHVVDMDAQPDEKHIRLTVSRRDLEKMGEIATWRKGDA